MPNVTVEEGAVTNALTLVRKDLSPWKIYSGNPARIVGPRDKDRMLADVEKFWKSYYENGECFD